MDNDKQKATIDEPTEEPNYDDDYKVDLELEAIEMEFNAQRQYEALVRRAFTFPY